MNKISMKIIAMLWKKPSWQSSLEEEICENGVTIMRHLNILEDIGVIKSTRYGISKCSSFAL